MSDTNNSDTTTANCRYFTQPSKYKLVSKSEVVIATLIEVTYWEHTDAKASDQ